MRLLFKSVSSIRIASRPINHRFITSSTTESAESRLNQKPAIQVRRSVKEVAHRAIATQLLLTRWGIEAALYTLPTKLRDSENADEESKEEEYERIISGNTSLQLAIDKVLTVDKDIFTKHEAALFEKKVGTWEGEEIGMIQPRWESLAVLLWSLRIFRTMAPYTENVNEKMIYEATAIIPAFPDTIATFVDYFSTGKGSEDSHFITDELLISQINVAEAYFWRAQAQIVVDLKKRIASGDEKIEKMPSQLKGLLGSIEGVISQATERALEAKLIESAVSNDFNVSGVSYAKLESADQILNLSTIASKRIEALGYLCGNNEWEPVEPVQFLNPINSLWAPVEEGK